MSKKCLVVDDNIETVDILKLILEKAGYEVHWAYDGQKGLELAKKILPDIILLDIMMPVMDGCTMFKHLKEDIPTQNIPVIIITARSGMAPMFDAGIGVPVQGYLVKPFERKVLIQAIENALKKPLA